MSYNLYFKHLRHWLIGYTLIILKTAHKHVVLTFAYNLVKHTQHVFETFSSFSKHAAFKSVVPK